MIVLGLRQRLKAHQLRELATGSQNSQWLAHNHLELQLQGIFFQQTQQTSKQTKPFKNHCVDQGH